MERPDPVSASSPEVVASLSSDVTDVIVGFLDDNMANELARLAGLVRLLHAGSSSITDAGVRRLATIRHLEILDLEWSVDITDDCLEALAELPRLSWVDLSFCRKLSESGLQRLHATRPTLVIETSAGQLGPAPEAT